MSFCMNCGAEVPDGARFCPKCGAEMNQKADHQEEDFQKDQGSGDFYQVPPQYHMPTPKRKRHLSW